MGGERREYFIFHRLFVSSRWRVVYREIETRDVKGRPLVWIVKTVPGAYEHGGDAQEHADQLNAAPEQTDHSHPIWSSH